MKLSEYMEYKKTQLQIVPGTHVLKFLDNLPKKLKQKCRVWRTEFGAGYGALSVSMLDEVASTLIVTAGPGITNILTVLAQAYNDRIPLIVIGVNNWSSTLRNRVGTIHELGFTNSMFEKVALESVCFDSAQQFCENIDCLYDMACCCRMPVYIDLPSDIFDDVSLNDYSYRLNDFSLPVVSHSFVYDCVKMISEAKAPILLCGAAAIDSKIKNKVYELSELLNLPIVTTIEASSFFTHQNCVGPVWDRIFIGSQYENQADAVLSIGSDLGVLETANGKLTMSKHMGVTSKIVNNYIYTNNIVEGDILTFVNMLVATCRANNISPCGDNIKNTLLNERKMQIMRYQNNYACHNVLSSIQNSYPNNTVFCSDVFLEGYAFAHFGDFTKGQKIFTSQSYVNLGFSLGATVGASFIEENVVCMVGDGGFGYYFTEISTMQKYNKRARILIFNNNCFGTIDCFAKENCDMYKLKNPDYAMIAKAYNLYFAKSDGADIGKRILEAEQTEQGYIIEINLPTKTPMFNQLKWF